MNHEEIIEDLNVLAGFITAEVAERSDDVTFEEAVALDRALTAVIRNAGDARGLLATRMLDQLRDGARQVGGRVFARVRRYKERTEHGVVETSVIDHAVYAATDRDTGEIDPRSAARMAVAAMHDLYLAPSTKVKTTKLEQYGVAPGTKVIRQIEDGWKLHVVETETPDEEG